MTSKTAVGAVFVLGALALGILQASAAAVPPPAPEAPANILQAVSDAMGDSPSTASADVAPAPDENTSSFGSLIARVAGVLIFILGLLYVSLLGMKRFIGKERSAQGEQIRVLGRTPLSPKSNVYLLRFGDQYLVVGEAGDRLTALASMPVEDGSEIEENVSLERVAAEENGDFSASLSEQQLRVTSQSTLRRLTEGVKKLRQETEKLLNIQNGELEKLPQTAPRASRREARRGRAVGAEAP
jgi:flagellar biosynthetic protein FliO